MSLSCRRAKRQRELENELKQIDTQNITDASKVLAKEVARVQAARDLQSIKNAQKQFEEDQLKAFEEQLTDLESEIAIEEAITEQMKNQLRLEQEIRKIRGDDNLTGEQKDELEEKLRALERAREENRGVSGYVKQLQAELMDTEAMIVSLAQTVQSELSNAMSTAVSSLVTGSQTIEETLANMFENIGKAFIDMAAEIITKQLTMIALQSILKALGGAPGGDGLDVDAVENSSIGADSIVDPGFIDGFSSPSAPNLPDYGVMPMASGGFVTSPTKAMIGEGGENEYVIPADKMSSALQRYNSGARGNAVIEGTDSLGGSTAVMEADGPMTINIEGGVMQIRRHELHSPGPDPSDCEPSRQTR